MADPADLQPVADLLAAMAHPVRVAALLHLEQHGPTDVSDLVGALGVEQSALSHQLRVLRHAGLVAADADGRRRVYRLADHHVAHIVRDAASHVGCGVSSPPPPAARPRRPPA